MPRIFRRFFCRERICLLLLLFVLPLHSVYAQTQRYLFDHFTMADDLPSNTDYRCACDSEGFLWVATSGGAARFDGKTFDVFNEADGLPDNDIVYLFIDSRNRIWFFGFNGRVSFYYGGVMHTAATDKWLQPLQSGNFVQYVTEDTAQDIYIVHGNGSIQCITRADTVLAFRAHGNLFFVHNKIWCLPDRTAGLPVLFMYSLYGKERIPLPRSFDRFANKQTLSPDLRGNLFCWKQRNVYRSGNNDFSLRLLYQSPESLSRVKYINDSNIALFAPGNGVYIYHTQHRNITQHLLAGETLTDAFMNARGDLWCTSLNNGLFYLPACRGRARYITAAEQLPNEKCTAIYTAGPDVWVGMDNATVQRQRPGRQVYTLPLAAGKKVYGRISNIIYTPAGYIGIAGDMGMFLLNRDGTNLRRVKFRAPGTKGSVLLSAVKSCSVAPNGDILVAVTSYAQRLSVADMSARTPVSRLVATSPDRILCVFEDSRRRTWFATAKGLHRIQGSDTISLYRKNDLFTRRILQIGETAGGYIVLATDGAGIIVLKDETVYAHITARSGLPSDICRKVFITGDTLYAATPDGVAIAGYNRRQGFFVHAVTGKDGLLSMDCRDVSVMNGKLYVATDKGVAILALGNIFRTDPVPYTYLKNIVADGKAVVLADSRASLRYGVKSILVSYGAVSQNTTAGVEYRYRTASGNNWLVTDASSFVYNDPQPQQMQVTVQSRYKGGEWDKGLTVSIHITPRFYQQAWFIILLIVLLVAGICAGFVYYYRRQRQRLYNRNKLLKLESQANQAMMNPHFVFNALNSVQHFMNRHDNYAANQYLTRFSRLIRRHLELNRKQYISLEEEFDFLRLYLEVEKSRCGDRLTFHIHIQPGVAPDEVFIPVLILQPLVENAVWHGITPKDEGGCILIAACAAGDGQLEISVTDDGVGFAAEAIPGARQSMGIGIIKDRLHLLTKLYGREFSINYDSTRAGSTNVTVRFPLLTIPDLIPVS